jgi:hypothetical protein
MKKITILVLILILIFVLPKFIKSLRFDFINHGGYGPSFSASKEEAIERDVSIGELEVISFHTEDDSINFKMEEGWIEKIWRRGTWYWTTKLEDTGYQVVMHTSLTEDEGNKLHMVKVLGTDNSESIGCGAGVCIGTVRSLPSTDTLKYNLRREDNLDFSEGNIIGELVLVVKKK